MLERIIVGSLSTNAYIYSEWKKECLLIDPGGDLEQLLERMAIKNLKPLGIVCTHGHLDHIAGALAVQTHFAEKGLTVPVAIHPDDAHYLGKGAGAAHKASFKEIGVDIDEVIDGSNPGFPAADTMIKDEETVFDSSLTVIHTPGHTPGSICLYSESQGILFSGDTLFFEGVGRTDLKEGDDTAILTSIKERLFVLPPETRVFPGHGPNTTIEREIRNNPYVRL